MADFNDTTTESVGNLDAFARQLEQLESGWQSAQEGIQQLEQHASDETRTLLGAIEALTDKVRQAREVMQGDVEVLGQLLDEVEGNFEARQGQIEQVLEDTGAGMAGLEESIEALMQDVDEAVQRAEGTMQVFVERAGTLDAALAEVTAQVDRHVQESVVPPTGQYQAEIAQSVTALQGHINERIVPGITEQVAGFQGHLQQVVGKLQAKFSEIGETSQGKTTEVMTEITQGYEKQQLALVDHMQSISSTIQEIGAVMQTSTGTAVKTNELLVDGAQAANTGLNVVIGLFREVEELLKRVGG
jgi:uncharacterized protein YukE